MTEDRLHERLSNIETKLEGMSKTLSQIAVQDNSIRHIEDDVTELFSKMNGLTNPGTGTISRMQRWQASCPRGQMKFLWGIMISLSLALLGIGGAMVKTGFAIPCRWPTRRRCDAHGKVPARKSSCAAKMS